MSWALSSEAAAIAKAGANANSDITASSSVLATWYDQAESTLNTKTRKDWVAASATITAKFIEILDDTLSAMVATNIINYDMSGYTSRLEVQTMLDVLDNTISKNIGILDDTMYKEVMD